MPDPEPSATPRVRCDARYWRGRARQAEADAARLRQLLLALARALPSEYAALLEADPEALPAWAPPAEVLIGWEPTPRLVRARVDEELERVWRAIAAPEDA